MKAAGLDLLETSYISLVSEGCEMFTAGSLSLLRNPLHSLPPSQKPIHLEKSIPKKAVKCIWETLRALEQPFPGCCSQLDIVPKDKQYCSIYPDLSEFGKERGAEMMPSSSLSPKLQCTENVFSIRHLSFPSIPLNTIMHLAH